ncbi:MULTISPECIES: class Ib ribonucleoside-diphosphate reductase assembly flavoprotein NrdI [unclassified Breznakia]|uniref:class Ib ribonucleoside-diphosphate reductase assembly flavoprotein NrdI n=1 Tax=unclassified Breznakia TaxID=2623764 RepID=UPI0024069A9C|nr:MULTISPECIES: class Ib ribonucleoside-diphosphate reductase assembly flavoprotein NrdI [unclassified Breznakia]MDF9837966.1 protein involved in ribonucleotide reduction [Breznakia sp. PFB2-8]MDF9859955.1 protein involved in ribonucleotide reduction [Breznakia sp. PH5-24]MDL2276225.1 class Ib ribonucleoside-diphosphate reductase assembly flavoprotein NrdI [Breznakia sp. OttesenSCG-928-G09]
MKIVYASRTGNIDLFIDKLGIPNTMKIEGDQPINEDFILLTYTDGYGELPYEVESFLTNNKNHIKGVIGSGDSSYGEEVFAKAADVVAENYGVDCLYKFENDGTDEDVEKVKNILNAI